MAERIMVSFEGDGSGVSELTWGQQHIWGAIQALGSTMNMCATRELPAGATVAECAEELRFYVSRFQAMRTLLQFVPGGLPMQVVVASGEVPLEIVDVPSGDDPVVATAALAIEHEDTAFDYAVEFPIRMALVRHGGALTHMVLTLSHFATDGAGGFAMYRDFMSRDPHTGQAVEPVRTQPLDLAAQQRTPAGKRQSDASLRYWEDLLRSIPVRRFRAQVDGATVDAAAVDGAAVDRATADRASAGRYWQVEMDSPAMFLAVRAIAARARVDVSTVLLGIYTTALARVTGHNPTVAQMLVSNRFRPGLADIVSNVSQTGLCVVDVAGMTVDEAIVATRRASLKTYKHAYFDLSQWKDLVARIVRDRGGDIGLGYYYNDRPSQSQVPEVGLVPTADEIEAAVGSTGPLRWTELPFFNERLMVTINDAPAAIALLVLGDTHFVSTAEMEAVAREMELVAVTAALDPTTPTNV